MGIGSGALTALLTFERETRTRQRGGDFASTWATLGQAWAQPDESKGDEKQHAGAVRNSRSFKFTCLAMDIQVLGVTTADRIQLDGLVCNIRSLEPFIGQSTLAIAAKSGVTQ